MPGIRLYWIALLAVVAPTIPVQSLAQSTVGSEGPVITIHGPTIIMFWTSPDSVADPEERAALYSALDHQQTTMADTREALRALGMVDVSQPGRRFRIRDDAGERVFTAAPDSSVVGYLLVSPGRDDRVLYRVRFTDSLLDAVRSFLAEGAPRAPSPSASSWRFDTPLTCAARPGASPAGEGGG